ncbi:UNVERIFIED_CONTAM: GTPase HflX [Sesamum latifolium]|uniref:GTPase HflX n=1 Tax=Sesamum latifolium TaxID=2727402 RepID=A0AAW2VX16_9LAMI
MEKEIYTFNFNGGIVLNISGGRLAPPTAPASSLGFFFLGRYFLKVINSKQMKNGEEFLLTDTVGIIQKLPTTLPSTAEQQIDAVEKVLAELDTSSIPKLIVWNKVDSAKDPEKIKSEAKKKADVICISALTGEGLDDFCNAVQEKLKDMMVWVEALIPFDKGELLGTIHHVGLVEKTEYVENGSLVRTHVPLRFARLLSPMRQTCVP